ncbi:MAG: DUF4404 family protein, partial [Anaerolineae bacterium]|nr:DUF4404 family protein [Anaerolineae bacterium]
MADTELHELLKKLDAEIEKTDAIDENGRTLLRDLDRDIRELLDRSETMSDTSHAATISGLE